MIDAGLSDLLKKDPMGSKMGEEKKGDLEQFSKAVMDCLEYNIIEWMSQINSFENSWLNKEYAYVFPNGYSEQAVSLADSSMIQKVFVDGKMFPNNPIFNRFEVECNLPTGGAFMSKQISDFNRVIDINSYYSNIGITIQQMGTGLVNKKNADILDKLSITNYDSERTFTELNYRIEIKSRTKILYRFSKEARLHPIWHKLLIEKFGEAYSFEVFKTWLQ